MKNYIYGILFAFICFISPLHLQAASSTPTISLNHVSYHPIHEAKIMDQTLYLSAEDFAAMTYGQYEVLDDHECLTIQNTPIVYVATERTFKVNHVKRVSNTPTYIIDGVTYLPIEILDFIKYPYTLSENQLTLSLTALMPFSTTSDDVNEHLVFETEYNDFYDVLGGIMPNNKVSQIVRHADSNKAYISLMSTAYKTDCLELMRDVTRIYDKEDVEIKVHLRQLDATQTSPIISDFDTLPLSYSHTSSGLKVNLGKDTYMTPFFWATYNPSVKGATAIDLNKSLDVMTMRSIYAYYRDQYDLKDDLSTLPMCIVNQDASEYISYDVYLDDDTTQNHYQVILYRMATPHTIEYYVDFIQA